MGDNEDHNQSAKADPPRGPEQPALCPVVGIGASAGGLEALKTFFEAMPTDSGIAFVVVLHLDPHRQSIMRDLLAKYTAMPVVEAQNGIRLEGSHVYVITPDTFIAIRDGELFLEPRVKQRGLSMAVDHLFRSIAEARGDGAVGIVLSGTGSDGATGLKEIKGGGGMTIVQKPETAVFDGMPRAALMTGAVDRVLAIEEMPDAILKFIGHLYAGGQPPAIEEIPQDHFRSVLNLLRLHAGADFQSYKKGTLGRRIRRRMGLRQIASVADYVELLRTNHEEVHNLFRDLLINVTAFFRDPEAWERLEKEIIVALVRERSSNDPIRVWAAGCASGEEAYSIAILLHEQLETQRKNIPLQVFATDLDEDAIRIARSASYPESVAAQVGAERLKRFFTMEGDGNYRVAKHIRDSVVCATQNLLTDPPFSKLDLISCRNVIMYFEANVQRRLIELFHFALRENGHLFLGKSETISTGKKLFEPVFKEARIYRRVNVTLPPRGPFVVRAAGEKLAEDTGLSSTPKVRQVSQVEMAKRMLLERFAPASVVVDRQNEVQYFQGALQNYLKFPDGEPTINLLDMAVDGVRPKLRVALKQAWIESQPVTTLAYKVKRNGELITVRIAVEPIPSHGGQEKLLLVSFADEEVEEKPATRPAPTPSTQLSEQEEALRQLEFELQATRSDLQLTIEELETSNEEMKASNEEVTSMNEELQSTNEELETSREELQSINEELATVNKQLEEKLAELESTNNDLVNLLTSTRIATLFLGTDLKIRRFTPSCTEFLHLIDTDIGRPIGDLAVRIADPNLKTDIDQVLDKLTQVEAEVQNDRGMWFLRRVLPYRTSSNRIDGVVVTFTDITALKVAARKLEHRERLRAALVELSEEALSASELQKLFDQAAKVAAGQLDCEFSEVLALMAGRGHLLLRAGAGWKEGAVGYAMLPSGIESLAGYALETGGAVIVEDLSQESRFAFSPLSREHGARSGAGAVIGLDGKRWGALCVLSGKKRSFSIDDVNFLKSVASILSTAITRATVEEELRVSRSQLAGIVDNADDAIISHGRNLKLTKFNRAAEKMFGYSAEEVIGQPLTLLIPDRFRDEHQKHVADFIGENEIARRMAARREVLGRRKDGTEFTAEASISKIEVTGDIILTAIIRDITERKQREDQLKMILGEVNHRTKNLLAVVQGIASQMAEFDPATFQESFRDRLAALASSQDLLVKSQWQGVEMESLVHAQLAHLGDFVGRRITLSGPALQLSAAAAQSLGMVLHELATNASKYGALSNDSGQIAITWQLKGTEAAGGRFTLSWAESGGPSAESPRQLGFGTFVIEAMPKLQLDADVDIEYLPSGLKWRLDCPAASVLGSAELTSLRE